MARLDPAQLRAAARDLPQEGVRLGQLRALAPGGQLPSMVVMCTVPAALPGLQLGWVCVPVLLYLSCALWRGQLNPGLPPRLANYGLSRKSAAAMLRGVAWVVEKFGRHCKAAWPTVVRRTRRKPAAALVVTMALVILLPIPGSNLLPALSIVALMMGLVWRDGRAVLVSGALSMLSFLMVGGFGWAAWAAVTGWL
ncbi:MAG: hypothetical protein EON92_07100 [Burkholderiales bacterium]|nr:MAG: hypothetical protein EON92_07100 [Burkholderiales bacterium]